MGSDAQMFVTLTNPNGINAGNDTTICSGRTTLLATGSATGYTWTANPSDASITTPNISNPTVSQHKQQHIQQLQRQIIPLI
jgi:hypothetical protein